MCIFDGKSTTDRYNVYQLCINCKINVFRNYLFSHLSNKNLFVETHFRNKKNADYIKEQKYINKEVRYEKYLK